MTIRRTLVIAICLISSTYVAGCDPTAVTSIRSSSPLIPERCGAPLSILRRSMNGPALQGISLTSGAVSRVTKGCVEVANLHLEGTTLVGSLEGQAMRGRDFIGTTVVQVDQNGASVFAVISDIKTDSNDMTGETLLYSLQSQNPVDGQVTDVCAPDAEGNHFAIPVSGTWDASGAHTSSNTQLTFGCTTAAIGKCVRLGYRPWASVAGVSLAGYHQACTRMVRFDYCGDGKSHTVDGTEIDVYDQLKLNTRNVSVLDPFDAAWTEEGAYCIERQRWTRLSTVDGLTFQALLPNGCLQKFEPTLQESSPVDPLDLCAFRSKTIPRSSVKMDNRSGINITLQ